ncbi:tyrosine-type recombinase/integrase [Salmonella enterica subsp. enterica serovar Hillegersberg]|uniref:integrase domain-containing protein n=1 Tax=Salmonella enterica TaxID=28901 RepID=UPI001D08E9AB|nr:integrase domain-containing protein [Salmonella enterica]MCB7131321.1 tyrosine-type recombinase/integrase [Salmonella enterica subsp. enterica serovar Hillegersberg]
MAVLTRPLSACEVQKAKPGDKDYELFDGQGLTLFVRTNGKKIWRFRYKRPGSAARTTITLGHYPAMSLASVRTLHAEQLSLLVKGIDPKKLEQEEAERERLAVDSLFFNVATKWFAVKKTKISADYADDIWKSLERDVFPVIGQTPVTELKAHTLIAALEPVRVRGALETLHRLTQRINEVMVFAIHSGLLSANPASTIDKAFVKPRKKHMPTIRAERLPELMQRVHTSCLSPMTRLLLQWQLLTLVRPSEAAGTMWCEIDMDKRLWTIPAARMKMKREHQVPLSQQAMSVLEQLKPLSEHSPFVFPGRVKRSQPMHSETVNKALWRMGYGGELVSHGFRALGSTTLNEAKFPPDVVEAILAHVDTNPTRAAYNHAVYMEQRVEVMDWWGQKISAASVAVRTV